MKDDSKPAFPNRGDNSPGTDIYDGMSLREWYAGLAMQGMLASMDENTGESYFNGVPAEAFTIADAMIAESGRTDD